MKKYLLILSIPLLVNISCKKSQDDNLPAGTQAGANTFGCLIDGKAWIPTGRGPGSGIYPTSGGFFGTPDGRRNIFIKAYSDQDYIHLYLKNIYQIGTYYLNRNTFVYPNVIYPASYGAYFIDGQDYYVTDSLHTGTVQIIHADTTTGIVSGTFEMQLYQKNTGKIMNITKGRFDYKTH